jgi:hypothetical protein
VLRRGRGGEKEIEQSCCRGEGDKGARDKETEEKGDWFSPGAYA